MKKLLLLYVLIPAMLACTTATAGMWFNVRGDVTTAVFTAHQEPGWVMDYFVDRTARVCIAMVSGRVDSTGAAAVPCDSLKRIPVIGAFIEQGTLPKASQ